jgi:hypothetical protein
MKRSIIVISVCESVKRLGRTDLCVGQFHFKGCFAGKVIRSVHVRAREELIKSEEYLLFLDIKVVQGGVIYADARKLKLITELKCEL